MDLSVFRVTLRQTLEFGRCFGYPGHELKRFLRILFCLFAEDNGIFPPRSFETFLRDRTAEDGACHTGSQ